MKKTAYRAFIGVLNMQVDFRQERPIGLAGEKYDSTASTCISMSSKEPVAFGALVCFDGNNENFSIIPKEPAHLEKPLGIALKMLHCQFYAPHSPMCVMRQGRVFVEAEKPGKQGSLVYIKFSDNKAIFTGESENNFLLKNAIFLASSGENLMPIEINFLGGV